MIYKYLHRHKWLVFNSKNEIKGLLNYNGVYMLRVKEDCFKHWKIIYVGETRNIIQRLGVHNVLHIVKKQILSYGKLVDLQILFCPMEGLKRKKLEGFLIRRISPMYNYIEKHRRSGRIYELNHTLKNKYAWLKFFKSHNNYFEILKAYKKSG